MTKLPDWFITIIIMAFLTVIIIDHIGEKAQDQKIRQLQKMENPSSLQRNLTMAMPPLAQIEGWVGDKNLKPDTRSKWFWTHTTNDFDNREYWSHHFWVERDSCKEAHHKIYIFVWEEK